MESKKHLRKLLQLYQVCHGNDREPITAVQNATSPSPPGSSMSIMALTLLLLLIALFFLAFFSVFIRHFVDDDDSTAEISSRRPGRRSSSTMSPRPRFSSRRMGLDRHAVRSLPVHRYTKETKQRIKDCVICISEFQEGETVKVIPYCGHVFHVDCVDTWLSSHASCPFCRSNQVLPVQDSAGHHDTCPGVGPCMRRYSTSSSCSSFGHRTELERSLSL